MMKRRTFLQSMMVSGMLAASPKLLAKNKTMKIHFLRHATFLLEIGGVKLLVDPMLSAKETMDPVGNAANALRIPMVDLPIDEPSLKKIVSQLDGVIVTHTHRDHWDARAQELLDKNTPIIIQPSDEEAIRQKGFTNLHPVNNTIEFKGIKIFRTGGQHGSGEVGIQMGHVSGFVLEHNGKRLYIAGDTIWCEEVEHALATHKPDFIVVNAGAAQFLKGGPITMDASDVTRVCTAAPKSKVVAVHMETINHCLLKRDELRKMLASQKITNCLIPADGETLVL